MESTALARFSGSTFLVSHHGPPHLFHFVIAARADRGVQRRARRISCDHTVVSASHMTVSGFRGVRRQGPPLHLEHGEKGYGLSRVRHGWNTLQPRTHGHASIASRVRDDAAARRGPHRAAADSGLCWIRVRRRWGRATSGIETGIPRGKLVARLHGRHAVSRPGSVGPRSAERVGPLPPWPR